MRAKDHELYPVWKSMKRRCSATTIKCYPDYGGRGITVCDKWSNGVAGFWSFVSDMGARPAGYTLDRIDNNAGYNKENCRWTDAKTQARNRESNRLVEYQGISKPIIWWSDVIGWPHHVIASRLRVGWSDIRSLTTPRRWTDECANTILSKLNNAIDSHRATA